MSRPTPIAERLEAIIARLRDTDGELRAGQTRQPRATLEDIRGDLEGIRLTLLRLGDHARGRPPRLADDQPDAPLTLARLTERLVGPPPGRAPAGERKPGARDQRGRKRPVEMADVPDGYQAGHVLGRGDLWHLVNPEPFNNDGLCGTQLHGDSLVDTFIFPHKICGTCAAIATTRSATTP